MRFNSTGFFNLVYKFSLQKKTFKFFFLYLLFEDYLFIKGLKELIKGCSTERRCLFFCKYLFIKILTCKKINLSFNEMTNDYESISFNDIFISQSE